MWSHEYLPDDGQVGPLSLIYFIEWLHFKVLVWGCDFRLLLFISNIYTSCAPCAPLFDWQSYCYIYIYIYEGRERGILVCLLKNKSKCLSRLAGKDLVCFLVPWR